MINLGEFKAGDTIFYGANFHSDAGALVDPSTPTARLRNQAGTWSDLTTPAKQDTKTGFYGGTIDTTGYSPGQHIIRLAGTVATAKDVATVFCFTVVANTAADIFARLGAPAGASVSADVAAVKADTAAVLLDTGTDGVAVAAGAKTGYTLTQEFPANFAALSITAGGLVDITQAAADKVWGTAARTLTSFGTLAADVWTYATRVLTAGTNIVLAKGTGLTGLNDLSAAQVNAECDTAVAEAGLATGANLAIVATYVDTEIQSILSTVNHATYGNSALNTDLDTLLTRLTDLRAGYLDNLSAGAAALEATLALVKAKTDNLPPGIQKNAVLNNFEFLMVDATDNKSGRTGLTITASRSIDGGAFAPCANAAAEVGFGVYRIDLAAADLNGDIITLKFSATGANDRIVTVKTSA